MQTLPLLKKHAAVLKEYGISPQELCNARLVRFSCGETFIRQGMPLTQLYFVASGKAKVCAPGSSSCSQYSIMPRV